MPNESQHPAGDATRTAPQAADRGPGYEIRDTNVRAVLLFAVGLFLMLGVVQVSLWALLRGISGAPEPQTPREAPDVISEQRRQLQAGERETLEGMVKGKKVPGRLSIDEAIDDLAERGLPAGGRARTEVDLNSHGGIPDRGEPPGSKTKDAGQGRGQGKASREDHR